MATQQSATGETRQVTAFGRGPQALEQSVWYSGWLFTFLATGEDTQGRFALLEGVTRKGNVPPTHIHHGETKPTISLRAR